MSTPIRDIILSRLETATGVTCSVDDLWHSYLETSTTLVGDVDDLHYAWLGLRGVSQQTLIGRTAAYLESLGYVGDVQDMFREAWIDGVYLV